MFKGAKKEDLRRIASELELCVSDKLTVLDFMDLIKNCDRYKNDPDSVHELANLIIEERKYDESQQLELEKIKEKSKLDLEIARIRANDKDNNTEVNCNDSFSVDSLIKKSSFVNLKFFVNAAKKKHHSSLCFSGDPNFTSERVIQPSSLGAERAGNRGILDESTFSEGVCVQTHKLHRGDFERGVF
ncbi:hypothetical protein TNCV_2395541 [Trichonephila clavipes]|nr:hypothetical protein TNCV_2395541 [Trichonephila clavipes]